MRKDILHAIAGAVSSRDVDVTEDAKIADIILDSMDVVEIIAVLTTRYHVDVPDLYEIGKIERVRDLIDFVVQHTGRPRRQALQEF